MVAVGAGAMLLLSLGLLVSFHGGPTRRVHARYANTGAARAVFASLTRDLALATEVPRVEDGGRLLEVTTNPGSPVLVTYRVDDDGAVTVARTDTAGAPLGPPRRLLSEADADLSFDLPDDPDDLVVYLVARARDLHLKGKGPDPDTLQEVRLEVRLPDFALHGRNNEFWASPRPR
jgi:hypothetical protein